MDESTTNRPEAVTHVIIGLGNPGEEYTGTRHNLGFRALDEFLRSIGVRKDFKGGKKARVQVVEIDGARIVLARPTTYMNLSGSAAHNLLTSHELDVNNLLVIHDEMDIPPGLAKMKTGGGGAGHNGVLDIIEKCGEGFTRIKIGIGMPDDEDMNGADFVLQKLTPEESADFDEVLSGVTEGMRRWIVDGPGRAIAWFNTEMNPKANDQDQPDESVQPEIESKGNGGDIEQN